MKKLKQTAEYSVYQRGDNRYAVKDSHKRPVNGERKVEILKAEGYLSQPAPKPAEPEPEAAAPEEEAESPEA